MGAVKQQLIDQPQPVDDHWEAGIQHGLESVQNYILVDGCVNGIDGILTHIRAELLASQNRSWGL